jgi:oligopeptide/dipeptide ABC transporter ATP-binding protein
MSAAAEAPVTAGPLLRVEGLRAGVRTPAGVLDIVRGVDLAVDAGQVVAVVGESGSGKSFTAMSVAGLLPKGASVAGGSVRLGGRELVGLPEPELRRVRGAEVAMVYQDPLTSLNPLMRIGAQVTEGLRAHGWARAAATTRTLQVLDEVGLPQPERIARAYPHQLSGGMRQRVLIASALAARPRLLIADEPTTALDVTVQLQIVGLVDRLRLEHGLGVVWITHDLGVVARIADRVLVMYAGRIAEDAAAADLFREPQHPYSDGLLRSVPVRDDDRGDLPQIGGVAADPTRRTQGCAFAPRCPQAREQCVEEEPPLLDRGASRAACWVPREEWS